MSKQEEVPPQKREAKDVLICIDFDLTMTTEHVHSMMNNAMKGIDQGQAPQLHKNNGVLLRKKVGEEQYQVSLDNDELSEEPKGVTGYQKNTAVIAKTNELLANDKIHLKNEEELKKTLKDLLKDGHPIAITSFSHFPDAIETIIQEKLGKGENALTPEELQKIQIVTGFPSDFEIQTNATKIGKTDHMLLAAENAGVGKDSKDRILLMDDTTRNVKIAQEQGMRGVAVPMVSYDKTTFSETPCKLEQYNYLSQLKTEAKNAVEGKPFEKINIEKFSNSHEQLLNGEKIKHEQILANPKAAEPAKAPKIVDSPKASEQPEQKEPAANKSVHVCFGFESLLENAEGFNQLLDRQAATGQTNLRPHPEGDLVFSFKGEYRSSKGNFNGDAIIQGNQAVLRNNAIYSQPVEKFTPEFKNPKTLKETLTKLAKQGNEISIVSFNKYPGIVEHEIDKLRLPKEVRSKISIISGSPDKKKAKDKDYSQHLEVVKQIADADSKEVVFFDSNEKSLTVENRDYTVLAPLDSIDYPEVLEVLPAVVETIAAETKECKEELESMNKSHLEKNKKTMHDISRQEKDQVNAKYKEVMQELQKKMTSKFTPSQSTSSKDKQEPIAVPQALKEAKDKIVQQVQKLEKTLTQLPLSEKEKTEVQDDLAKVSQALGVKEESKDLNQNDKPTPTTPSTTLTDAEAREKLEAIQQTVQNQKTELEKSPKATESQTEEHQEEYKVAASKIGNICKIISLVVDKMKVALSANLDKEAKKTQKLAIDVNIAKEWDAFKGNKAAPTPKPQVINNPLSKKTNSNDGWTYNSLN